jgi:hypothetical protein
MEGNNAKAVPSYEFMSNTLDVSFALAKNVPELCQGNYFLEREYKA